jgi:cold shock CspA family protein
MDVTGAGQAFLKATLSQYVTALLTRPTILHTLVFASRIGDVAPAHSRYEVPVHSGPAHNPAYSRSTLRLMTTSQHRYQGIVSDFDSSRGRGVIEAESGVQVLVRYSAIVGTGPRILERGEVVSFSIEHGPNGPRAVQVTRTQRLR